MAEEIFNTSETFEEPENNNEPQIVNPVHEQVGSYQAQFDSIRQTVYQDIQNAGSTYCMNVQRLVKSTVASNLEIYSLAQLHGKFIERKLANQNAELVNCSVTNAMFSCLFGMIFVEFDLSKPAQSIINAKHMNEVKYSSQYDCVSMAVLAKRLQILMATPISDEICIKYEELMNKVQTCRKELIDSQKLLRETIFRRAFTAFDFKSGMSFYTLNYSDDLSMLFWDRYTIIDITAKSYYVEQHCIVEHIITNEVEQERFIALHKPSKNSMAAFLSAKLACLTSMVRPQPTNVQKAEVINENVPAYSEED